MPINWNTGPDQRDGYKVICYGYINGMNTTSQPNNNNTVGSLNRSYNISSHSGNMASNDHGYDGGMTVNLNTASGHNNYPVVVSAESVWTNNWSQHYQSVLHVFSHTVTHAYSISSGSFGLKGWGVSRADDFSTSWRLPAAIAFTAYDPDGV